MLTQIFPNLSPKSCNDASGLCSQSQLCVIAYLELNSINFYSLVNWRIKSAHIITNENSIHLEENAETDIGYYQKKKKKKSLNIYLS